MNEKVPPCQGGQEAKVSEVPNYVSQPSQFYFF